MPCKVAVGVDINGDAAADESNAYACIDRSCSRAPWYPLPDMSVSAVFNDACGVNVFPTCLRHAPPDAGEQVSAHMAKTSPRYVNRVPNMLGPSPNRSDPQHGEETTKAMRQFVVACGFSKEAASTIVDQAHSPLYTEHAGESNVIDIDVERVKRKKKNY